MKLLAAFGTRPEFIKLMPLRIDTTMKYAEYSPPVRSTTYYAALERMGLKGAKAPQIRKPTAVMSDASSPPTAPDTQGVA